MERTDVTGMAAAAAEAAWDARHATLTEQAIEAAKKIVLLPQNYLEIFKCKSE